LPQSEPRGRGKSPELFMGGRVWRKLNGKLNVRENEN